MRDATAAAEPPLEPAGAYAKFQGFSVGLNASGSVITLPASSGRFVLPRKMNPASRNFVAK
jgi:hypothetical protein